MSSVSIRLVARRTSTPRGEGSEDLTRKDFYSPRSEAYVDTEQLPATSKQCCFYSPRSEAYVDTVRFSIYDETDKFLFAS